MPHFDDTEHPLIRMTITGAGDPGDSIAFMTRIEALIEAGQRFVLVLDHGMAHALWAGGQWRRVLLWAVRRRRQLKRTCAAVAVTATEAALPRVERATRSLAHMIPAPISIFSEVAMAEQWVNSRLPSGDGQLVLAHPGSPSALVPYRMLGSGPNP